jgi:hypothetical protein
VLSRRLGYNIERGWQPEVTDFLASRAIDLVLDVGANAPATCSALRTEN